jgi:chromosome segregation ATPase
MIKYKLLVASAALYAAFCFNAEAKLYKWVDANGTTHYGETIPPEYANRDTKLLEKGRITDRNETFDTDKQKSIKKETAGDKAIQDARRHDEALLNSYSNENEIDLARDRNLMQIEARINSYSTLIKSSQATLDDLHKESDSRTQQGRKVPQSLTDDIAATEARIAKLQKDMDANQNERDKVKARYDADKLHYRELKSRTVNSK